MSDPTDPDAPDVPVDDADPSGDTDPSGEPVPVTDPDEEPVAQIPEGPLDEESHIGEPLPEDESGDAAPTGATAPERGEEE